MFLARGPDSKDWDEKRDREVDQLLSDREREFLKARNDAYFAATEMNRFNIILKRKFQPFPQLLICSLPYDVEKFL